jgi:hypothetical protein
VIRVIVWGNREWGETESGTLEVDKGLQGRRRLRSLTKKDAQSVEQLINKSDGGEPPCCE